MTLKLPFAYPKLYKPQFFTLWASFAPFIFGESERILWVRAYLSFWEERGFSFNFSSFSIPSMFFKWENFYKYENLNLSSTFTCFLNWKHFFTKLQNVYFIELHETNSSILDCKPTFSYEYHEIHITIEWNMFLHDPTWKYHLMESCSNFQFLVEISPPTHEIGNLACLSSLWVLEFAQLWFTWEVENKLNKSKN